MGLRGYVTFENRLGHFSMLPGTIRTEKVKPAGKQLGENPKGVLLLVSWVLHQRQRQKAL